MKNMKAPKPVQPVINTPPAAANLPQIGKMKQAITPHGKPSGGVSDSFGQHLPPQPSTGTGRHFIGGHTGGHVPSSGHLKGTNKVESVK